MQLANALHSCLLVGKARVFLRRAWSWQDKALRKQQCVLCHVALWCGMQAACLDVCYRGCSRRRSMCLFCLAIPTMPAARLTFVLPGQCSSSTWQHTQCSAAAVQHSALQQQCSIMPCSNAAAIMMRQQCSSITRVASAGHCSAALCSTVCLCAARAMQLQYCQHLPCDAVQPQLLA